MEGNAVAHAGAQVVAESDGGRALSGEGRRDDDSGRKDPA